MPLVLQRVQAVKAMREQSSKAATRQKSATPSLFTENRQPTQGCYLAIPRTSSEHRHYLPIAYLNADVIAANDLQMVPQATLYHFGVLSSTMHRAWTGITAGRLKSDIRYSVKLTYNTFPWPDLPEDTPQQPAPAPVQKRRQAIAAAAQAVLDARAQFADSTLADLYDPLTMPVQLSKAHQQLDKAVDAAYGYQGPPDDTARVAFLFARYQALTAATAPVSASRPKRRKA